MGTQPDAGHGEDVEARGWPRVARAFAGLRVDVSFAVIDTVVVVAAYMAALLIRFADRQGSISPDWWHGFWKYLPVVIVVHLLVCAAMGAYGHVWEFASVEEAMRLVMAALISVLLLLLGLVAVQEATGASMRLMPVTVVLLGSGLALGGMGAVRFRSRLFSFRRTQDLVIRRALVVGGGRATADLARRGRMATPPIEVVGLVDDVGSPRRVAGVSVVGSIDELPDLISSYDIDEVVIAANVGPETTRQVVDLCVAVDVHLRTLPDVESLLGPQGMGDVRDLELADLLPRPTVHTDLAAVKQLIAGRRVLVTGAGGSIGSEIVNQILRFDPQELIALDHDEGHLYDAGLGWTGEEPQPITLLADICDRASLDRILRRHRPQVIFHAAAHKHVPILEAHPDEAVKTNVAGTRNLIDCARRHGAERFVLISTDKAVEPSSVMGASKRVAEMMVQTAADSSPQGMVLSAVRFGNVLGSRGSVVPTFMYQIQNGGPVTVSDPDMLRYFMLTSEAVELVLQAAALAEGGEIYVLDMGEPIRIGDLAHRMIRLSGLIPGRDIAVEITGARPGEKGVEVLSHLPLEPSSHPRISLAQATHPGPVTMSDAVALLESMADDGDCGGIRDVLMALSWQTWSRDETLDIRSVVAERLGESA